MPSTYTRLTYHLVFSTKERRPLITSNLQKDLYPYIGGILRNEGGVLLEAGGIADHIHLLARVPAKIAVAEMLQRVKGGSSRWINESGLCEVKFQWQDGYSAFTVSESQIEVVRSYIQTQEEHHRKSTFKEELLALLQRHGIEFDERYLWD